MRPERWLVVDKRQVGLLFWQPGQPCRYPFQSDKSIVHPGWMIQEPLAAGPNQIAGLLACPTQTWALWGANE
jgi:hypothetical protein